MPLEPMTRSCRDQVACCRWRKTALTSLRRQLEVGIVEDYTGPKSHVRPFQSTVAAMLAESRLFVRDDPPGESSHEMNGEPEPTCERLIEVVFLR